MDNKAKAWIHGDHLGHGRIQLSVKGNGVEILEIMSNIILDVANQWHVDKNEVLGAVKVVCDAIQCNRSVIDMAAIKRARERGEQDGV